MTQGTTKGVPIDTDGTMSLNSNQVVPSQAAVVTYVGTQIGTAVTSVSGTANRITSTGGASPVIDISSSYVGQSSITTLGTIATGVWNGTDIALADGGTNASLTASNGGIFYSTATAGAILAGTATASQLLLSGASTTPSWSASTYPSTNAVSTILYASSSNVMSALATANDGILVTSHTGVPSILAGPGATGKILQSNSILPPSYSTATYPSVATGTGTILRADGTNWAASTATYPNTAGTSGKVLISDGTNIVSSTPTFPNASATSGKIIKSDGTNWVASTETYAAPGSSGNVLTSDGTNWLSSAAGGGSVSSVTGTLTNAQIKALHATPITLISAPGAGKVIVILQSTSVMNYGGTNIFVDGGGAGVILSYSNTTNTAAATFMPTGQLVASSSRMNVASGAVSSSLYSSNTNLAVLAYNSSVTEISGNAANNNTISYSILYTTMTP